MCLLVIQNKTAPMLSDEWLRDFYKQNPDGIGVMYSHKNQLIIEKTLPKSAEDFIQFYKDHIFGRDCAFHLRMKTHGNIDLENCHPYEVLNKREHGMDLWLMHNGILHTDNKNDVSKSDTWHYIRDFLQPMLKNNPEFAFHPSFIELVSEHIGSGNKFVLMNDAGKMSVINQESGVYWAGLWLSNTYAWSASASASKTPLNDPERDYEQSIEKPVKYLARSLYSGYGYPYTYHPSAYDDEYEYENSYGQVRAVSDDEYADDEALCDEIDSLLLELDSSDRIEASQISFMDAYEFCQEFGFTNFFDLVYMCIEGSISEEWFIKAITDPASAKESFPFLSNKKVANYD